VDRSGLIGEIPVSIVPERRVETKTGVREPHVTFWTNYRGFLAACSGVLTGSDVSSRIRGARDRHTLTWAHDSNEKR
jgi:hypothetical protein